MELLPSPLEEAFEAIRPQAQKLARQLSELLEANDDETTVADAVDFENLDQYKYALLGEGNTVFVGHTNTDLDSVASAIGAAYLFKGRAAKASRELNGETLYVLERFGEQEPPYFADLKKLEKSSHDVRVCLVDHNQRTQLAEDVEEASIVGILDHHALQSSTVCTNVPILIDIRPWGSTCTIVARLFMKKKKKVPHSLAGLLLGGILSDTLNLRSPTTTPVDRVVAAALAKVAGLHTTEEVTDLAHEMFTRKALALAALSPHALVMGDHKVFSLATSSEGCVRAYGPSAKVGFAVVESTDVRPFVARIEEIVHELIAVRRELGLTFSFCAIVDTLGLKSVLICAGPAEAELARHAFRSEPGASSETTTVESSKLVDLGSRVSRKLDFIPALTKALLDEQWTPPSGLLEQQATTEAAIDVGVVVASCTDRCHGDAGGCCVPVRRRNALKIGGIGLRAAARLAAGGAKKQRQDHDHAEDVLSETRRRDLLLRLTALTGLALATSACWLRLGRASDV